MKLLQLDPSLPMSCPKGQGEAFLVIDYGKEDDLLFSIALDSNGEIWSFPAPQCRFLKNISIGRELNGSTKVRR